MVKVTFHFLQCMQCSLHSGKQVVLEKTLFVYNFPNPVVSETKFATSCKFTRPTCYYRNKDEVETIGWMQSVAPTGGGNRGSLHPGPQCKGAPKQCRTCSNKIRSSVTFQSCFFKVLVSLYFWLKTVCSFALRFILLTQIMHNYRTWLLRSPLATAPYVVLFDLKPLIKDGNLQVYMYCVHTQKKSLRSPQNTLQSM